MYVDYIYVILISTWIPNQSKTNNRQCIDKLILPVADTRVDRRGGGAIFFDFIHTTAHITSLLCSRGVPPENFEIESLKGHILEHISAQN